jgi:hypothetical protein
MRAFFNKSPAASGGGMYDKFLKARHKLAGGINKNIRKAPYRRLSGFHFCASQQTGQRRLFFIASLFGFVWMFSDLVRMIFFRVNFL